MGQGDILELLKKHPEREFNSTEIAKILDKSISSIIRQLMILRRTNFLNWREEVRGGGIKYSYKYKGDDGE